jgi:hypothetical protein
LRFFVARQTAELRQAEAFPRRQEIERAEILRQLHGLVDDALFGGVVAHFHVARERKVLAQRMAFEAVVGEQAAQIGMVGEIDAVEVPGFALEPACRREQTHCRFDRRVFVGAELHTDAPVVAHRQEIVDDVETFGALGPIDAAKIHEGRELARRIVAQMAEHAQDRIARHGRAQFALFDFDGQNVGAEIGLDLVAERGERWIEIRSHVADRSCPFSA